MRTVKPNFKQGEIIVIIHKDQRKRVYIDNISVYHVFYNVGLERYRCSITDMNLMLQKAAADKPDQSQSEIKF